MEDGEEVVNIFKWFVRNVPAPLSRFIFGWKKRKDDVNNVDFSFIADNLCVIRLYKRQ